MDHTALMVAKDTETKPTGSDTITDWEDDELQEMQQISWLGDCLSDRPPSGKKTSRHGRVLTGTKTATGRRQQGAGTHTDFGLGQSAPLDAAALLQWSTAFPLQGDRTSDGDSSLSEGLGSDAARKALKQLKVLLADEASDLDPVRSDL